MISNAFDGLLMLLIVAYIVFQAVKNRRLSGFAWIQLCLILLQNGISVGTFIFVRADESSFFQDMTDGIVIILFLTISLNFSFRYFTTSNIIYRFSKSGRLPTEKEKFNFRVWIVILNLFSLIAGFSFAFAYFKIIIRDGRLSAERTLYLSRLAFYFLIEITVIAVLFLAVKRLSTSRAKATDPGLLQSKMIKVILILFLIRFLLVIAYNCMIRQFTFMNVLTYAGLYFLQVILEYLYVYVIATSDLHEFKLQTILRSNDKLDLIAVGLNGNEMFKFTIDQGMMQSHPNPLGLSKNQLAFQMESNSLLVSSTDSHPSATDMRGATSETRGFIDSFQGNGYPQMIVMTTNKSQNESTKNEEKSKSVISKEQVRSSNNNLEDSFFRSSKASRIKSLRPTIGETSLRNSSVQKE